MTIMSTEAITIPVRSSSFPSSRPLSPVGTPAGGGRQPAVALDHELGVVAGRADGGQRDELAVVDRHGRFGEHAAVAVDQLDDDRSGVDLGGDLGARCEVADDGASNGCGRRRRRPSGA